MKLSLLSYIAAKKTTSTVGEVKRGRISRTSLMVTAMIACAGCAAEQGDANGESGESTVQAAVQDGTAHTTIFGGSQDDDFQSAPGVVALRVGTGGTFELCSGALIAPNVVLTARHCVAQTLTTSVSCDENGKSANGEHVAGNNDPATVGVYVGPKPSLGGRPDAVGKAIVAPTGPYLCDSDVALLILDRDITDVAPLAVRLAGSYETTETIRSVGYGQNDDKTPIGTRFRKDGVSILAQGRAVSKSNTPLGSHEFEVGMSICQGDSGGPAISEKTGAVIGVVSRGGECDENFGHIYTTTVGFDDLFTQAFAIAGGAPKGEQGDSAGDDSAAPASDDASVPASSGGCSTSGVPAPVDGRVAPLALVLAALLVIRRRRAA